MNRLVINKSISGCVRMACENLLMTSYPQQILNQSAELNGKLTDLLQIVDKLQQAGITGELATSLWRTKTKCSIFCASPSIPCGK